MTPTVAVITPLFGHAQYIGTMLESLQAQTFQDWECHVRIDGRDDGAWTVACAIAERDHRISVTMSDEREGVAAARNRAVDQTTAPWLLPFDADDIMHPDYLERLVNAAAFAPPDAVWPAVFTSASCLKPNGKRETFHYPPFNPARFVDEFQVPNSSLHPRAMWEAIGGWDESWTHGAEDWHYWTRAVALNRLHPMHIHAPLWTYREHQGSRNSVVGRQYWSEHKKTLQGILEGRNA